MVHNGFSSNSEALSLRIRGNLGSHTGSSAFSFTGRLVLGPQILYGIPWHHEKSKSARYYTYLGETNTTRSRILCLFFPLICMLFWLCISTGKFFEYISPMQVSLYSYYIHYHTYINRNFKIYILSMILFKFYICILLMKTLKLKEVQ